MAATVMYSMNVSLDGFAAAPDGSLEFTTVDEEIHRAFNVQDAAVSVAIYGRRLWDVMSAYWPTADQDPDATDYMLDYARVWQAMPKIVVSRSLHSIEGPNVRLVDTDPVALVTELRDTTDGVITLGGPTLAAALVGQDLVDEYRPFVHPALLGGGLRFLPEGFSLRQLELVDRREFASGAVALRYRRRR